MRWKCFGVVLFLQAVAALPPFQWDTVPTYVHCANMSGPWNAMALDRMTHKGVGFVVFEKVRAFVPATRRLEVCKTRPSVTYNILHISIHLRLSIAVRADAGLRLAAGKSNICIYTPPPACRLTASFGRRSTRRQRPKSPPPASK